MKKTANFVMVFLFAAFVLVVMLATILREEEEIPILKTGRWPPYPPGRKIQ